MDPVMIYDQTMMLLDMLLFKYVNFIIYVYNFSVTGVENNYISQLFCFTKLLLTSLVAFKLFPVANLKQQCSSTDKIQTR